MSLFWTAACLHDDNRVGATKALKTEIKQKKKIHIVLAIYELLNTGIKKVYHTEQQ